MNETLKIYKIVDPNGIVPMHRDRNTKSPKKKSYDPKAFVFHWTQAPGQPMFNIKNPNAASTLQYLIYIRKSASYNVVVTENGEIIEMVPPEYTAFHAGANKYTEFANKYFGDVCCPPYEHTEKKPHRSSPNFASLGFCMAVIDSKGNVTNDTWNGLVKAAAYYINRYYGYIKPYENFLCHSDLVTHKNPPCPRLFYENKDIFLKFKREVDILCERWKKEYKHWYPELTVQEIIVT